MRSCFGNVTHGHGFALKWRFAQKLMLNYSEVTAQFTKNMTITCQTCVADLRARQRIHVMELFYISDLLFKSIKLGLLSIGQQGQDCKEIWGNLALLNWHQMVVTVESSAVELFIPPASWSSALLQKGFRTKMLGLFRGYENIRTKWKMDMEHIEWSANGCGGNWDWN